jgi:hypothetical protein
VGITRIIRVERRKRDGRDELILLAAICLLLRLGQD